MWNKINNFLKGREYEDGSRGLLRLYLFSILLSCQAYAVVHFYLGAKFMAFSLFSASWIFTAFIFYLDKKKYFTAAKLLLVFSGMFYVSATHIGIKQDIGSEFYCIPAIMMTLVFFDIRQKVEIFLGVVMALLAWAYLVWGPVPNLSSEWIAQDFPASIFRIINFLGSVFLTIIFSNEFGQNVLKLRKSIDEELKKTKESEKILENAQRMAKMGNWEFDLQTDSWFWSKEQRRICEVDERSNETLMEQFKRHLHPEDKNTPEELVRRVRETKSKLEHEYRIISNAGEIKYVLCQAEPLFDSSGNVVRLVGTAQDVTDQRKLHSAMIDQQMKMVQNAKLASIGEMAAGVAHEINNPLMIIHGKISHILRILGQSAIDSDKLVIDLKKVLSTTERIAKIIRGLRMMGRVTDSDPMLIASLKQIIDETLDFGRERLKTGGVELKVNLIDDVEIECRSAEIGQVILNLVNNAFDAIHDKDERWIELKVKDLGSEIEIYVIDSGNGISPSIVSKMMNPFFTTKEVGKGTGLGLSISMGIMKGHYGDLRYQEDNHHTCFVISLPKRQPTAGSAVAA